MKYTVQAGDTLSKIASKIFDPSLGLSYKDLADYNNITNPNLIRIGQVLDIPDSVANPDIIFGPSGGVPPIGTQTAPTLYNNGHALHQPSNANQTPSSSETLFGIPYKWLMIGGGVIILMAILGGRKR